MSPFIQKATSESFCDSGFTYKVVDWTNFSLQRNQPTLPPTFITGCTDEGLQGKENSLQSGLKALVDCVWQTPVSRPIVADLYFLPDTKFNYVCLIILFI